MREALTDEKEFSTSAKSTETDDELQRRIVFRRVSCVGGRRSDAQRAFEQVWQHFARVEKFCGHVAGGAAMHVVAAINFLDGGEGLVGRVERE